MNDKLKKALKIGAIALGVGAYTFLAFSVGACAGRKSSETKADEIGLRAFHQNPKFAPNYDRNLLSIPYDPDTGKGTFSQANAYAYADRIEHVANYSCSTLQLEAGLYYFDLADNWSTFISIGNGAPWTDFMFGMVLAGGGGGPYPTSAFPCDSVFVSRDAQYFYLDAGTYAISYITNNFPYMALVSESDFTAKETFELPERWFPWQWSGGTMTSGNSGVIVYPSQASTGYGASRLNGLLFRSNGRIYNRINVEWNDIEGAYVGYYDANGILEVVRLESSPAQQTILRISYEFFWDNSVKYSDVVRQYTTAPYWNGSEWIDIPTPYNVVWSSPEYKRIEVLDVTEEEVRPVISLIARNPIDWLKVTFASEITDIPDILDDTNALNVISSGFTALIPILSVSVLPGITFGLLIFLPIIAGIIIVIIKVIKK